MNKIVKTVKCLIMRPLHMKIHFVTNWQIKRPLVTYWKLAFFSITQIIHELCIHT